MDLLEGLRKSVVENQAIDKSAKWQAYQSLLRRLVDGKKVDPNEIGPLLDAIGKTIDDIPSDLDNMKFRDQIRQRGSDAEHAKPKLHDAQDHLDGLKKQREDFLAAIVPQIERAAEERDRLSSVVDAGGNTENELLASCRDPGLRQQLDTVDAEMRSVMDCESDLEFRETRDRAGLHIEQLKEIATTKSDLHKRRAEIVAAMVAQ